MRNLHWGVDVDCSGTGGDILFAFAAAVRLPRFYKRSAYIPLCDEISTASATDTF